MNFVNEKGGKKFKKKTTGTKKGESGGGKQV